MELDLMEKINITINIPKNFKIIIWKKKLIKKIILLNCNYRINLLYKNKIIIDKWSNSITFLKNYNDNKKLKTENKINSFLNSLNMFYFKKIKFKGKGFRIKFFKKIKLIKFYFGKSHKTFLLLKKIKRKRINKYKFILYGVNKKKLTQNCKIVTDIKKINFYTLRGLRLTRQIIFKRKGKKGTYI